MRCSALITSLAAGFNDSGSNILRLWVIFKEINSICISQLFGFDRNYRDRGEQGGVKSISAFLPAGYHRSPKVKSVGDPSRSNICTIPFYVV